MQRRRRSRCPPLLLLRLLRLLLLRLLCLQLLVLALGKRPWSVLLLLLHLHCLRAICLRRRRARCALHLIQRHCQLSRLEQLGQAVGRHTQPACKRRHRTHRRRVQHSLVLPAQQRQRWRRLPLCHCWHLLPVLALDCWLLAALLLLLLLLPPLLPLLALPILVLLAASLLRCAPTANSQPCR